jgi:hypothetical protein
MEGNQTPLPAVSVSIISLTACTGEQHKNQSAVEAVPVTVGECNTFRSAKWYQSAERSHINSAANVSFLVSASGFCWAAESCKKGQVLASSIRPITG